MLQAFLLGNAAILTNVCLLPLYPGLVAYLAGQGSDERRLRATPWLGLFVLAGVLVLMTAVGALLTLAARTFEDVLLVLLPAIYAVVILLGVLMLFGRNPFAGLQTAQAPLLRNPYLGAFVYGLLLGPMTLPCAGPIVVSAFVLGAGSVAALGEGLLFFFFFGLGFGWPLVLLPMVAAPLQRRFTTWMTRHYGALTRASGVLLVGIGLLGIFTDLLPNL